MRHVTAYNNSCSVRRLSWYISIHFVAVHCWSMCCSRKLQKNH